MITWSWGIHTRPQKTWAIGIWKRVKQSVGRQCREEPKLRSCGSPLCHHLVYTACLCTTSVTAMGPRQLVKSFSTKHSCRGLSPLTLYWEQWAGGGGRGVLAAVKE